MLPFISVPVATHTGWNTRHPSTGGGGHALSTGGASGGTLRGSTIPFAATRELREVSGDPRPSIEERYDSREHYLDLVNEASLRLIEDGYLLEEDLEGVAGQAAEHYDLLRGRVEETQPVGD